jgi:hypothetical protein
MDKDRIGGSKGFDEPRPRHHCLVRSCTLKHLTPTIEARQADSMLLAEYLRRDTAVHKPRQSSRASALNRLR